MRGSHAKACGKGYAFTSRLAHRRMDHDALAREEMQRGVLKKHDGLAVAYGPRGDHGERLVDIDFATEWPLARGNPSAYSAD